MKLFFSPGTCSLGIHVILEEIGHPYELERVNLRQPPAERALTAINPKSKVPTLQRDDGSVLTQWPAIALWLGRRFPAAHLLPPGPEVEVRAIELIDYMAGTVHMQGFSRLFNQGNFAPAEADAPAVRAKGLGIVNAGFALLAAPLADKDWLLGPYSVADAALFFLEFWAKERFALEMPGAIVAHYDRMRARPAVAAVLRTEELG
jgi:glutathione S-transferase